MTNAAGKHYEAVAALTASVTPERDTRKEREMKETYVGGCQCGNVRFEVLAEIGEVIACNCSRCRRSGALLSAAALSDFKLISGGNDTTDFQFNRRIISLLTYVRHPILRLREGPTRPGYGHAECSVPRRCRRRQIRRTEIRWRQLIAASSHWNRRP